MSRRAILARFRSSGMPSACLDVSTTSLLADWRYSCQVGMRVSAAASLNVSPIPCPQPLVPAPALPPSEALPTSIPPRRSCHDHDHARARTSDRLLGIVTIPVTSKTNGPGRRAIFCFAKPCVFWASVVYRMVQSCCKPDCSRLSTAVPKAL